MKYWHYPAVVLLALALIQDAAGAQPKAARVPKSESGYPGMHIGDSLTNHLQVLNFWGQQPEAMIQVYAAAFRVLESKPEASFTEVAADAAFQQACAGAGLRHLGGPLLGAISPNGARVWVRTLQPANVEVRLVVNGGEKRFGPVRSAPETDLTAVVPVEALPAGGRFPYQVYVDGKALTLPSDAVIRTPGEVAGETRIVFGSCFHSRLGNPALADQILRRQPAAWLLIGDIAADDKKNHLGRGRSDYLMRDFLPAWQRLAAAIPTYAVWDDHDYFWNDASGIPPGHTRRDMEQVWEVFRRAWNNPSYGFGDDRRGVFLRTRVGSCDVLLLDTRSFRNGSPGSKDAFLGRDQMQWLEEQLLDCRGPFIIISSGTMWSDYVSNGKDSWGKWDPNAREHLFSFIEKHRIPGVLLISGDRHGARGFRIPRPSGYVFYEFEAASLGGWTGPERGPGGEVQLYGELGKVAFGEFTVDSRPSDPTVQFRLTGDQGTVFYELQLSRSQLTPGQGAPLPAGK